MLKVRIEMENEKQTARKLDMNDYYELTFTFAPADGDAADYLAALLADAGFESFVHDENEPGSKMTAYVPAPLYSAEAVEEAVGKLPFDTEVSHSCELVPGQDWNSEWEKHYFKPIVIEGRVVVHSSFHTDVPEAEYDILIDPRMAFGTGHHPTTTLMLRSILDTDIEGRNVTDMGTGTAILAILAAMRGAASVTGIEIDPAAADNAVDNVALNLPGRPDAVRIIRGDASALPDIPKADIFLANINRNIITADVKAYAEAMKDGAQLTVSGFYVEDRPVVAAAAEAAGLVRVAADEIDNWSSMTFKKQA